MISKPGIFFLGEGGDGSAKKSPQRRDSTLKPPDERLMREEREKERERERERGGGCLLELLRYIQMHVKHDVIFQNL